ncbi:flagellar biosynthesis protein FlhF [Halomonas sp. Bachu 37]|uniref:flagellar biosynthesis protein FlhF n=1 Tax=Halomonas kashgarensis TaxID=3084920 RepID=UPI0032178C29
MSVRRFVGANSRDVMRQVREALGDDALILANRRTEDGVEILAMADEAVDHFDPTPESPPVEPNATEVAPPATPPVGRDDPLHAMSERLLKEMQDMRELLATEKSRVAATPAGCRQRLLQVMREVGFSHELADDILTGLPEEYALLDETSEQPLVWLRRQLADRLHVLDAEAPFFDQTGIVALVGPTGVGKTTTTAKLAARFVMRHGTRPVALVTTDSFRIGAHEQLRIYARLLDTPMYALDAEQPIDDLLGRLQGKQWVIIDTVGMSQRDQRVIEQIAHLQGGRSRVRLVLLLNAASQPETLEEVVMRYRQAARAAGAELDDCIITKQDEAGRLAPVLDIVMRHGLRILFGSHGQRVPEDMAVADAEGLVEQALTTRTPMPGAAESAPASAVSLPSWSRDVLGQGRRLSALMTALRKRVVGFSALEALWDMAALPMALQDERLSQLLEGYPPADSILGMAWSPRRNERGCDWAMPDIGLDADGAWVALPWLQHRHPAGWRERLAQVSHDAGVIVHLLPGLPAPAAWVWLEEQQMTWVSLVRSSQRVEYGAQRTTLGPLLEEAPHFSQVSVRFRGQVMQLHVAREAVQAPVDPRRASAGEREDMLAWRGEIRDPENAKVVARRYWLTPVRLGDDALSLLLTHLQSEGLAALTRRAWQQLKEADGGELSPEIRLLMASGLAAVAGHLDVAEDEAAAALRANVLGLAGNRRRRRDIAMLDGLAYAFMARDAIRQFGSAGLEGMS